MHLQVTSTPPGEYIDSPAARRDHAGRDGEKETKGGALITRGRTESPKSAAEKSQGDLARGEGKSAALPLSRKEKEETLLGKREMLQGASPSHSGRCDARKFTRQRRHLPKHHAAVQYRRFTGYRGCETASTGCAAVLPKEANKK